MKPPMRSRSLNPFEFVVLGVLKQSLFEPLSIGEVHRRIPNSRSHSEVSKALRILEADGLVVRVGDKWAAE